MPHCSRAPSLCLWVSPPVPPAGICSLSLPISRWLVVVATSLSPRPRWLLMRLLSAWQISRCSQRVTSWCAKDL